MACKKVYDALDSNRFILLIETTFQLSRKHFSLKLALKILVDDMSSVLSLLVMLFNLKLAVVSVFLPYIIPHLWRFCLHFSCLHSYFKLANNRVICGEWQQEMVK